MPATTPRTLRAGTRRSRLARWQTDRVGQLLEQETGVRLEPVLLDTEGDRRQDVPLPEIGGTGVFTEALQAALRGGEIDLAVHSLKDLPIAPADGLVVAAVLDRADPADVLIAASRATLQALPSRARVATSSLRREGQLLAARPDLVITPLRGNVETRIRHAHAGHADAIVLAAAGLERLGLGAITTERLPFPVMLPAPGQGALAVECRQDDAELRATLALLDDPDVRACVDAERGFLAALGGGCAAPVAALGRLAANGEVELRGRVVATDGSIVIDVRGCGPPAAVAASLAEAALAQGAAALLAG